MIIINIIFLALIFFFDKKIIYFFNKFLKLKNVKTQSERPTLGGYIILSNIVIYVLLNKNEFYGLFQSNIDIYIFLLSSIIIFIIGAYDDLYQIVPLTRLILISLILIFFLNTLPFYQVFHLKSTYLDYSISINKISIYFTIICFLILINSINMFDGLNGQSGLYFFQIFVALYLKGLDTGFIFLLLISILFFLVLNLQNKIYMGDGGIYLTSFILGIFFINGYHIGLLLLEDIVVYSSIIIFDFLRVFLVRTFSKKHPFKGDKMHIHHICTKKYGILTAMILIQSNIFLTILVNFLFGFYTSIFLSLFLYFFIIYGNLKLPNKI